MTATTTALAVTPASTSLVGGLASVKVTGCPHCGFQVARRDNEAQQRILELESQVKFLNQRAAATGMLSLEKIPIVSDS